MSILKSVLEDELDRSKRSEAAYRTELEKAGDDIEYCFYLNGVIRDLEDEQKKISKMLEVYSE